MREISPAELDSINAELADFEQRIAADQEHDEQARRRRRMLERDGAVAAREFDRALGEGRR